MIRLGYRKAGTLVERNLYRSVRQNKDLDYFAEFD